MAIINNVTMSGLQVFSQMETPKLKTTTSKERMVPEVMFLTECMLQTSIANSKIKWPLCFAFNYVQPVSQCYKQRSVEETPLQYADNFSREAIALPRIDTFWLSAKRNRSSQAYLIKNSQAVKKGVQPLKRLW